MGSFIATVIEVWVDIDAELRERGFISKSHQSADGEKAGIEIEGPDRVALVEVWERAQCLDTTVLYVPSRKSVVLAAGTCESQAEAFSRLETLKAKLIERSE
jgi:hypothetical protein